jgi:sporulation protein YlmC with PRC-barrel domain
MPSDRKIEDTEIVVVDVRAVARGYRASRLIGEDVVNDQEERIGTLDDIVIGRDDRVLFAILQVGGFLGLGGHLVAVPYQALTLGSTNGTLELRLPGATRDALSKLPEFAYGH